MSVNDVVPVPPSETAKLETAKVILFSSFVIEIPDPAVNVDACGPLVDPPINNCPSVDIVTELIVSVPES